MSADKVISIARALYGLEADIVVWRPEHQDYVAINSAKILGQIPCEKYADAIKANNITDGCPITGSQLLDLFGIEPPFQNHQYKFIQSYDRVYVLFSHSETEPSEKDIRSCGYAIITKQVAEVLAERVMSSMAQGFKGGKDDKDRVCIHLIPRGISGEHIWRIISHLYLMYTSGPNGEPHFFPEPIITIEPADSKEYSHTVTARSYKI